jgi:hypothetical protein
VNIAECLQAIHADPAHYQLPIGQYIDDFRRASSGERRALVADPAFHCGQWEALLAGVVSSLCRECEEPLPPWVEAISSPVPYFPFPAKTFAMRVLLMLESPLAFKLRRVFVPMTYMRRA